jgi:hypothetical protein
LINELHSFLQNAILITIISVNNTFQTEGVFRLQMHIIWHFITISIFFSLSSEVVWRKSSAPLAVIILLNHPVSFSRTKKTVLNLAWSLTYLVCDVSLSGIVSSKHGCLFLVSFVYCHVEVSASGRPLVQRSPTECSFYECDREASIMCGPLPTRGLSHLGGK